MIIYKATNSVNGKIYIGKTKKSLEERKKEHLRTSRYSNRSPIYFYNALNKYGFESFRWEIIDRGINDTDLSEKEIQAIKINESCDPAIGYNISTGGTGGDIFTNNPKRKEICDKLSKAHMGKHVREDVKVRIRRNLTGRKRPPQVGEKISNTLKGRGKGRKLTETTRLKIGLSHIGKHYNVGKKPSKETIQKRIRLGTASKHYIFLSDEIKTKIIDLYMNGNSLKQIAKMVNFSPTKISKTLQENSIPLRISGYQKGHKYYGR